MMAAGSMTNVFDRESCSHRHETTYAPIMTGTSSTSRASYNVKTSYDVRPLSIASRSSPAAWPALSAVATSTRVITIAMTADAMARPTGALRAGA